MSHGPRGVHRLPLRPPDEGISRLTSNLGSLRQLSLAWVFPAQPSTLALFSRCVPGKVFRRLIGQLRIAFEGELLSYRGWASSISGNTSVRELGLDRLWIQRPAGSGPPPRPK